MKTFKHNLTRIYMNIGRGLARCIRCGARLKHTTYACEECWGSMTLDSRDFLTDSKEFEPVRRAIYEGVGYIDVEINLKERIKTRSSPW